MRQQQLIEHVTNTITAAFENDVADAILEHKDTVENLARHLGRTYSEAADNPAAWLYSQIR